MAPIFINSPTSVWTCTRNAGPDLVEPVAFAVTELHRAGYCHADVEPIREMLRTLFMEWQTEVTAGESTATGTSAASPFDSAGVCSHTDLFIKLYAERYDPLVRLVGKLSLLVVMPVLMLQDAADRYVAGALRAYDLLKRSRHCVSHNSTGEIVFDDDAMQHSNMTTGSARITRKRESRILTELEASTIDNIVFTMEDQIVMEDLLCARTGCVPGNSG